jgi:hypothetical protein
LSDDGSKKEVAGPYIGVSSVKLEALATHLEMPELLTKETKKLI